MLFVVTTIRPPSQSS